MLDLRVANEFFSAGSADYACVRSPLDLDSIQDRVELGVLKWLRRKS